mmetsp:Transcript_1019/g.2118  ORF Transcript_1019/g.2118 Transcript_1019/m.2118 type:complete len:431 (-) Transcript_1019:6567-7859(-)
MRSVHLHHHRDASLRRHRGRAPLVLRHRQPDGERGSARAAAGGARACPVGRAGAIGGSQHEGRVVARHRQPRGQRRRPADPHQGGSAGADGRLAPTERRQLPALLGALHRQPGDHRGLAGQGGAVGRHQAPHHPGPEREQPARGPPLRGARHRQFVRHDRQPLGHAGGRRASEPLLALHLARRHVSVLRRLRARQPLVRHGEPPADGGGGRPAAHHHPRLLARPGRAPAGGRRPARSVGDEGEQDEDRTGGCVGAAGPPPRLGGHRDPPRGLRGAQQLVARRREQVRDRQVWRHASANHSHAVGGHANRLAVGGVPRQPVRDDRQPEHCGAGGRREAMHCGHALALRGGAARGGPPSGEPSGQRRPHQRLDHHGRRPPAAHLVPALPGHGVPARRRSRHRQPVYAGAPPRDPHASGRARAPLHPRALRGH